MMGLGGLTTDHWILKSVLIKRAKYKPFNKPFFLGTVTLGRKIGAFLTPHKRFDQTNVSD